MYQQITHQAAGLSIEYTTAWHVELGPGPRSVTKPYPFTKLQEI